MKLFSTKKVSVFFLLVLSVLTIAAEKTIECGKWRLTFDSETGYWKALSWNNVAVGSNPTGVVPFNWGPAWPGGKEELPDLFKEQDYWMPGWNIVQGPAGYRLESYSFDKVHKCLTMKYRVGAWKLHDEIVFEAKGHSDILSRTLHMVYASPTGGENKPTFFANVTLNFPIAKQGRYFFPGRMNIFANHEVKMFSAFPLKGKEEASWCSYPVFLLEQNQQTAMFLPDEYKDLANFQLTARREHVFLQANFKSYGWAYPDQPQVIGPVYLKMSDKNLEQTFQGGVWTFFDDLGIKVPADRPEWVADAMLYCLHPGGNVDANLQNLGGFNAARSELLPRVAGLGFNTLWVMPIEESGIYCPADYRSIKKEYGTPTQYQKFIRAANGAGMKILQDIVPHGGRPESAALRDNRPWDLIFDKNGRVPGYGCFDYGSPDWQKYIHGVAVDLMTNYKLDGFRVDVPDGSRQPNFRRNGDPAFLAPPGNVSTDWWKAELGKIGGKFPPHAFMRASNTRRESGLQMLSAIRSAVKSVKRDGVILGEVCNLPYMTEADIVYDMSLYSTYIRKFMASSVPGEYVQGLSRYLEQQKYAEPRGTLRLRYTESHDSLRTRTAIGLAASRAWLALIFLIDGIPMVYQDMDIGDGTFIKELTGLRRSLPELRRGDAFYLAAQASKREIFCCVRRVQDQCSIGLINFSPDLVDDRVTLPAALLPKMPLAAWDCRSGKRLFVENGTFRVRLSPWEYAVIAFRPETERCPVDTVAELPGRKTLAGKPVGTTNEWGSILVKSPSYELQVNSTGMMNFFKDQAGHVRFDKPRFIYDSVLELDSPLVYAERPVHWRETDYGVEITATIRLSSAGIVGMTYRCYDDRVEWSVRRENLHGQASVGMLLSLTGAEKWRVNTAEGVLEDEYRLRNMSGQTGMNKHRVYRMQGTPILWSYGLQPLDFNGTTVNMIANGQTEASIGLKTPLEYKTAEMLLLDRYHRQHGLYAAFFWARPEPLFPAIKSDTEFTIVLRNGIGNSVRTGEWTNLKNGLRFRNESLGWRIENQHYSVKLLRSGGVISTLRDKAGNTLIGDLELSAGAGFLAGTTGSSSADIDASVRIWEENGKLYFRFDGMLRTPMSAWGSIIRPGVFFSMQYVFDSSSEIGIVWSVINEKKIATEQADAEITMTCPSSDLIWWCYGRDNRQKVVLFAPVPEGKNFALPQTFNIRGKDNSEVFIHPISGLKRAWGEQKKLRLQLDFPGDYVEANTLTTGNLNIRIK